MAGVRQIDQFTKLTDTKVANEISNVNSNIELVKEKNRVDHA
jgi:hypothetical protein